MKDIDKLKGILNGWCVPFKEEEKEGGAIFISVGNDIFEIPMSPKVTGYMGFYTEYRFTSEGEFIEMGAWE